MDAEIQAMEGNKLVVQMLDSGNMPTRSFMFPVAVASVVVRSLPSLDAGFRHPCRNDGHLTFVYYDKCSCLGINKLKAPSSCLPTLCRKKLELLMPRSLSEYWERAIVYCTRSTVFVSKPSVAFRQAALPTSGET